MERGARESDDHITMTVAAPARDTGDPPEGPAASHRPTRRLLARGAASRARMMLGVVLLLAGVGLVDRVETGLDELLEYGSRTEGIVVAAHPGPWSRGSLEVAFVANGERRHEILHLSGSGPAYREGARVTIVFDPSDPSSFRTPEERNDGPARVLPFAAMIFAGGALASSGVLARIRCLRRRRLLKRSSWRSRPFRFAGRRDRYVALGPVPWDPVERIARVRRSRGLRLLRRKRPARVWVASAGARMLVAPPGPVALIAAREARSGRRLPFGAH